MPKMYRFTIFITIKGVEKVYYKTDNEASARECAETLAQDKDRKGEYVAVVDRVKGAEIIKRFI